MLTNDEYYRWSAPAFPARITDLLPTPAQSPAISNSASPARLTVSETTNHEHHPRLGQAGQGEASSNLPEGLPHANSGQSQTTHLPVTSRATPELACGRAAPRSSYAFVNGFGGVLVWL